MGGEAVGGGLGMPEAVVVVRGKACVPSSSEEKV